MANKRKVYVVINNWIEDYQIEVFAKETSALNCFMKIVRENIAPDTEENEADSIVMKACKDRLFDYSGDGCTDREPFVQLLEEDVN